MGARAIFGLKSLQNKDWRDARKKAIRDADGLSLYQQRRKISWRVGAGIKRGRLRLLQIVRLRVNRRGPNVCEVQRSVAGSDLSLNGRVRLR